jgi:NosR/NirI family transcriptional regulator, nitrous oxide reductase regulator
MFFRHKHIFAVALTVAAMILLRYLSILNTHQEKCENTTEFYLCQPLLDFFPRAVLTQEDSDIPTRRKVFDENGELLGYFVLSEGIADKVKGYAGPTPVMVAESPEGDILGIYILASGETPAFLDLVKNSGILENFAGLHKSNAAKIKVDAVTGATLTSRALIETVRQTIMSLENKEVVRVKSTGSYELIFTVILVFMAISIVLTPLGKIKGSRLIVLAISFIWLGIYRSELISIDIISRWAKNGAVMSAGEGLFFIAVVTILISVFFGKSLYCYYLCPFGALQEFTGKVIPGKKYISGRLFVYLSKIRYALLLVATLMLFWAPGIGLDGFEPFTVFSFRAAGKWVILIAGVSVLLSFFVYRPWCNFLCPTGAFFEIFRKKGNKKSFCNVRKVRKQGGNS